MTTFDAVLVAVAQFAGGWALGIAWADTRIQRLEAVVAAARHDDINAMVDVVCPPPWQSGADDATGEV